jgi:hypothetical protein
MHCDDNAWYAGCFNITRLPSIHSVGNKSMKQQQKPGINHDYLTRQQQSYEKFKEEKKRKGKNGERYYSF